MQAFIDLWLRFTWGARPSAARAGQDVVDGHGLKILHSSAFSDLEHVEQVPAVEGVTFLRWELQQPTC